MNVEFQIHGVLSSGQKTWKLEDQDYYKKFYCDQNEDILMIIEIVDRPHGVSAYYNYLRNNNILSAREGSYFGMTIRIDGAFCRDVKGVFMILDNLFNKMIVDKILIPKGDKFEYAIDSFATQNEYLTQLERQFSNMLSTFCSQQDFIRITSSWTSQGMKQCVNASEISIATAIETIKQRAKLYLSPDYQSAIVQKKIDAEKARAEASIANAEARIKAAEQESAQSSKQRQTDFDNWKKEKQELEEARDAAIREFQALQERVQKERLNTSINEKIAEIKKPLTELAGLMADRFQDAPDGSVTERKIPTKRRGPSTKDFKWLPWALCLILCLALACVCMFMEPSKVRDSSDLIKQQAAKIEQLENQIKGMSNPVGASSPQVGIDQNQGIPEPVTYDYSKLRVDIQEFRNGDRCMKSGNTYHFSIKGGDFPHDGYWVIVEGNQTINDNKMTVTATAGTPVSITYYHGTDVVATRTLKVE